MRCGLNYDLYFIVNPMYLLDGKFQYKRCRCELAGFKSAKSLVRISFVDVQPVNFWKTVNQQEYGFWYDIYLITERCIFPCFVMHPTR